LLSDRISSLEGANHVLKTVIETLITKKELAEITETLRKEMAVILEASETSYKGNFEKQIIRIDKEISIIAERMKTKLSRDEFKVRRFIKSHCSIKTIKSKRSAIRLNSSATT
jgi:uncharacterized membrane protein